MVCDETWFESNDETKLFLHRWIPEQKPSAVLHIVHGMAEHGRRYERLAQKFAPCGIEVWAADQRGHGKTADSNINEQGKGGLLGHCADNDGFMRVTADIHAINEEINKTRPGVPLFLLGHSWGAFIVQNYIEEYPQAAISGCILSGTAGPAGLKVKMGIPVMALLTFMHKRRGGSHFAKSMADGSFSRHFRPNRTAFDWLSRDEKEVDAYIEDPHCGFLCSTGFYYDLARGLYKIYRPGALAKINPNLPIYIFSGSADPVGNMEAGPTALVKLYKSLGISNLELVLYPGARHEALNETNKEEVMENLLSWILKQNRQENAD